MLAGESQLLFLPSSTPTSYENQVELPTQSSSYSVEVAAPPLLSALYPFLHPIVTNQIMHIYGETGAPHL